MGERRGEVGERDLVKEHEGRIEEPGEMDIRTV